MDDRSPSEPDDLPEELLQLIKPELQPGERLLWASRAGAPSIDVWPSKVALVWFLGLVSIAVACFAALAVGGPSRLEGPGALLAVVGSFAGIIALVFPIYFVGNFFSKQSERRRLAGQTYALTDRRAVIWVPTGRADAVSVHTYRWGTIRGDALHRVQYPDGSGDVLLHGYYGNTSGFFGIADVRRVEELVRRFLVDPDRKAEPDSSDDDEFA